jgi:hypothetical protein
LNDHIPRWKIAVAAGVVAAVAAAVAVVALVRGQFPVRDTELPPPEPAPSALSPAPADAEHDAVISGVRNALDAWEAFARTADLGGAKEAFVVDGPQYRQFEREARNGRAGVDPVPTFSLQSVGAVEPAGRRREVAAQVALTDGDGSEDVREWVFVLEPVAGAWRVWTVIDRTGA